MHQFYRSVKPGTDLGGCHPSAVMTDDQGLRAPLGRVQEIWQNIASAGPLAIAGVVANGSNVIVTVLLAHLLVSSDYGYLNQLIGLFLIVSTPGSAVIVAVVRRATQWRVLGHHEALEVWAQRIHRAAWWTYGVYLVVVVAVSGGVARELLAHDTKGRVIAMLAGAGLWVLLCIDRGFLQATRAYRDLSINLLVEGGVRAVAVLGFVAIRPSVFSACVGILVAEIATFTHARFRANAALRVSTGGEDLETAHDEGSTIVRDLVTAVVAMVLLAVLQNADVILLGRLRHEDSGSYAAISVASKSLYFVAIVLSGYLVPEAAIRWRQGAHALRPLAATFAILAVPASVLFAAASIAPHLVLGLVFSSKYLGAEEAFSTLVLAMVCLSVTVVLTLYLLAIGKRWITALLGIGAFSLVYGTLQTHGQPVEVARVNLAVQGALAALVSIAFALTHLRSSGRRAT